MNAHVHTYTVKNRDLDKTIVSLRLTSAEAARFWKLHDLAKTRSPYIGKSDVARELFGLIVPTVFTTDEIHYFRTGEKPKGGLAAGESGLIEHGTIKLTKEPGRNKKAS